jgi:hypothetical protein
MFKITSLPLFGFLISIFFASILFIIALVSLAHGASPINSRNSGDTILISAVREIVNQSTLA